MKGRAVTFNPENKYLGQQYDRVHWEGIDDWEDPKVETQIFMEHAKSIVNKVPSPDLPMHYSINPYQGCEHGCAYCYARNTHQYYGYGAGIDFESKLMVKKNAPLLLEKKLSSKNWRGDVISIAGNTDCYQPIEREHKLTRQLLQVCLEHKQAVGIVTKNHLILRDSEILKKLAALNLVQVHISINSLDEKLRAKLEPRTSTVKNRLRTIETLSEFGIPVNILVAPIIPSLNDHEIPDILEAAANRGALSAAYIMLRLNGVVDQVFSEWLEEHYPDRKNRVLNQVKSVHKGKLSDSQFGHRMSGSGPHAERIRQLFGLFKNRYFHGKQMPRLDTSLFMKNKMHFAEQLELF